MTLSDKIVPVEALPRALATLARPIVFTNGVFDLLHRGHVEYLADARALGGSLVIGLNSDASARLLGKGEDRPINQERDRAIMLAALEAVSIVCLFDERTPMALLEHVRPDLYVKGGDYDVEALPESTLVKSWGGLSRTIQLRPGYSTTRLVDRIRAFKP
ncbi:D-glycero-beta-D-manno-heptose 1-phosphate adenylyltransferase [Sphingomonas sp. AAP5]|uniref:adenylyltransferase/cytidyltransferase family protein n=1 Tax=Sphingomonas sp. AAP5 TaxID=1523415 RepID=UPI0010570ABD|nr:adenylyltransferase/cytidyltransferase family protein [Sphingomonas sp. AAP5]QBM76832.1 D-glycero-beta-D-manno-heptose 1-phosphate adenylyltransferase [Sphingomonas sp. AAP5]